MKAKYKDPYTLHLFLTFEWYDKIASGEKTEEYRGDYWTHRLYERLLKYVTFHRGYTATTMTFEIKTLTAGYGNPEWGAPITRTVNIIKLGKRIS